MELRCPVWSCRSGCRRVTQRAITVERAIAPGFIDEFRSRLRPFGTSLPQTLPQTCLALPTAQSNQASKTRMLSH
jgi:hypothetical protein